MRVSLLWIAAVCTACAGSASSTAGNTPRPDQTVRVMGAMGSTSLSMTSAEPSAAHQLTFAPERVWLALPGVFDSLGIRVQTFDPAKRSIGNEGFVVRHRLKNVPLSRYLDCGGGQMGANADDYDVRLSMMAQVRPAEGGTTTIVTTVEAAAKPSSYAQDYTRCTSKGALESKFIDLVKARLAR